MNPPDPSAPSSSPPEEQPTVLLVEDALDEALLLQRLLQEAFDCRFTLAQDGIEGCRLAEDRRWDLLIVDLNLPGRPGADVIRASLRAFPDTPVLAVTGHESYVQEALDAGAGVVLLKPLEREEVLDAVRELSQDPGRRRTDGGMDLSDRRVLAVGGLPGDVEAGCGGILLGHRAYGQEITLVVVAAGGTPEEVDARRNETERAAARLEAELILPGSFGGGTPSQEEIDAVVDDAVERVRPDTLYTPSGSDTRSTRTGVHEAALASGKKIPSHFAYQSAATTLEFHAALVVDIADHFDQKLELLTEHRAEADLRPHLRTEVVEATARYWGRFLGYTLAEPLEVIQSDG